MYYRVAWPANNLQLLLIPLLTMRLLAEEKRSGTFEMLVTAPVRDHEVVLAKFLAAVVVCGAMWLILPLYAVVISRAGGNPDFGPVWGTYIGVVGVGVVFVSIGLMASAGTQHQILAAFVGIMLNIGVLYLPLAADLLPESWSVLRGILATGNLVAHSEEAARGILDLVNLSCQAALSALFLLFAVRILEVRKWR
jgi:ABC-2 type transport system permease protein